MPSSTGTGMTGDPTRNPEETPNDSLISTSTTEEGGDDKREARSADPEDAGPTKDGPAADDPDAEPEDVGTTKDGPAADDTDAEVEPEDVGTTKHGPAEEEEEDTLSEGNPQSYSDSRETDAPKQVYRSP
jgi:hypothetical protein